MASVLIYKWFPGYRYLVDVSITHPGAPSFCQTSAFHPLHAAKEREKIKFLKYQALAASEDSKFVPFVLESYGGLGVHARIFLKEIISQSKDQSSQSLRVFRDMQPVFCYSYEWEWIYSTLW